MRISSLPEDDRQRIIYFLLLLSPISGQDERAPFDLSRAVPNLTQLSQGLIGDALNPLDVLAAATMGVGSALFDTYATYVATRVDRDAVFVPWAQLRKLLKLHGWNDDELYVRLAIELDDILRNAVVWPHRVRPSGPGPYGRGWTAPASLFYDERRRSGTPLFWKALDRSVALLAQLVVWVDTNGWWGRGQVKGTSKTGTADLIDGTTVPVTLGFIASVADIDPNQFKPGEFRLPDDEGYDVAEPDGKDAQANKPPIVMPQASTAVEPEGQD